MVDAHGKVLIKGQEVEIHDFGTWIGKVDRVFEDASIGMPSPCVRIKDKVTGECALYCEQDVLRNKMRIVADAY
jgi:hypothetical protein